MTYVQLAWRNLMKNRRRTIITVGTIALALVLVTVIHALQAGNSDEITAFSVRQFAGDLQVTTRAFHDDPVLANSFAEEAADWSERGVSNLEIFAPRVSSFGLVSSDSGSAGAMVMGIDPEREMAVTTFSRRVTHGESLTGTDTNDILVGYLLARTLDVAVGDTIAILSQGMRGEMAAEIFAVKGFLRTNQTEIDRRLVVMPLTAAQEFFFMPGRLTHVVYRTIDMNAAVETAQALENTLPADVQLHARAWPSLIPQVVQLIEFAHLRNGIFMAFLLLLVAFEIFNTTMMSVLERGREFGLLQSIGMRPLSVGVLVAVEWLTKIVLASVVGLILAYGITLYLYHNPIPLGGVDDVMAAFGFELEYLRAAMRTEVFTRPVLVLFLIAIPSLVYPFAKTVQQRPLDALRTT